MVDHNLRDKDVREDNGWTFYCDECDLPFMQPFWFHNKEYHNGSLTQE